MQTDGLAIGQLWRDKDKRSMSGNRIVEIVDLSDFDVYYDHPTIRRGAYRTERARFVKRFVREEMK